MQSLPPDLQLNVWQAYFSAHVVPQLSSAERRDNVDWKAKFANATKVLQVAFASPFEELAGHCVMCSRAQPLAHVGAARGGTLRAYGFFAARPFKSLTVPVCHTCIGLFGFDDPAAVPSDCAADVIPGSARRVIAVRFMDRESLYIVIGIV